MISPAIRTLAQSVGVDPAELEGLSFEAVCQKISQAAHAKGSTMSKVTPINRPHPAGERMTTLAKSFPTLRSAPGVEPWNPGVLDEYAATGSGGGGAQCAARFVLGVWNGLAPWKCGRFDLFAAINVWDGAHLEAWQAWAKKPWVL